MSTASHKRRTRKASEKGKKKSVTSKEVNRIVKSYITTDQSVNVVGTSTQGFDTTPASLIHQISSTGAAIGIKNEYIRIDTRFLVANPASAGTPVVRTIIFQWFPDAGADIPVPSDILVDSATADSVMSMYTSQLNRSKRYKILKDITFTLGESTSVEGTAVKVKRFMFLPKNLARKIQMNITSTSLGINEIFMFVTSNIAAASSAPTILIHGGTRTKTHRL